MVSINLYQPNIVDCTIEFPSNWNEIDCKELIEFSNLLLKQSENPQAAKGLLFYFIIKNRAALQNITLPVNWQSLLDLEQIITEGLSLLDFLYQTNELTIQPFPFITLLSGQKMYGTDSGFNTLTCAEFEDCEPCFYEFSENPSEKPLAELAAILYRPLINKKYINFLNNEWVSYNYKKNIEYFLHIKPEVLYSIFIWYSGCRSLLPKLFPTVYNSEQNSDPSEIDKFSFTKCIHASAGPKNGTRSEIRRTLLLELMFEMEQEAIKAKELKEQYEQHERAGVH